MVQERRAVTRLDRLGRPRQRRRDVALLQPHAHLMRIQPLGQRLSDAGARHPGMIALVPDDRQLGQRQLGLDELVGHHRDRIVAHGQHMPHPRHRLDRRRIEALQLAAEHRALRDRRVQHVRQLQVDRENLPPVQLVDRIQTRHRLADDRPLRRLLDRHVVRHRQLRRRRGQLAITQRPPRRRMRHHAAGRRALAHRHGPARRRRLDQHRPRRRPALAHVIHRPAQPPAPAGRHVAPGPMARQVFLGRHVLRPHVFPIRIHLVGHQLRQPGHRPLTHLGPRDPHHDGIVRMHDRPHPDLSRSRLPRSCRLNGGSHREHEGSRSGRYDEMPAIELHRPAPTPRRWWQPYAPPPAPDYTSRIGRYCSSPRRCRHRSASLCPPAARPPP